jgi:hypothetical protein
MAAFNGIVRLTRFALYLRPQSAFMWNSPQLERPRTRRLFCVRYRTSHLGRLQRG